LSQLLMPTKFGAVQRASANFTGAAVSVSSALRARNAKPNKQTVASTAATALDLMPMDFLRLQADFAFWIETAQPYGEESVVLEVRR
jgi:hypothetical protein